MDELLEIIKKDTDFVGYCTKSNKALAELLGKSPSTVSRYISQLEWDKKITVYQCGGRSLVYN